MSAGQRPSASLLNRRWRCSCCWEFRNEQRPAPEPQQIDEPIDNEPNAPYEMSAAPPSEDDQAKAEPAELIIDPPTMDVRKLRPKVMLHIHLSEEALLGYGNGKFALGGVGRFEGVGPVTLGQVRRFLADTNCDVRVQPVIDPQDAPPVDSYEIPRRIREAMFRRVLRPPGLARRSTDPPATCPGCVSRTSAA